MIGNGKFAEVFLGPSIVGIRSFLGGFKATQIFAFPVDADQGMPAAIPHRHPFKSTFVVMAKFGITLILGMSAFSQVAAAVVQPVSVTMVSLSSITECSVHIQHRPARFSYGIDKSVFPSMSEPSVMKNTWSVYQINRAPKALGQWNFYRRKSHGSQLFSGIHGLEFKPKVQAYGGSHARSAHI